MKDDALLRSALAYHKAGLVVLPNDPRRKFPAGLNGWQTYQPTEANIRSWFANGRHAVGVRDVEGIDIDEKYNVDDLPLFDRFADLVAAVAPGLLNRLLWERTPTGGWHLVWRCDEIEGNQKLATRPPTNEELRVNPRATFTTLIETRGKGGQFQVAPSPGYELVQGDWTNLPIITPAERRILLDCARALSQSDVRSQEYINAPGDRAGDRYNDTRPGEALRLLEGAGWRIVYKRGDVAYLRRPGKKEGISATYGHVGPHILYVFSSSASPFEMMQSYKPFAVFALLEHNGDYKAAARALYEAEKPQRGSTRQPARPRATVAPDESAALSADDDRPAIECLHMDIPTVASEAWSALADLSDASDAPVLYQRGSTLCRVEWGQDGAVLAMVEKKRMRGILARAAVFQQTYEGKNGSFSKIVAPPEPIVDDMLVNVPANLPPLNRVVRAPCFAPDGSLLMQAGYHRGARAYYDPIPGVKFPHVSLDPSREEMERARSLFLDDLLIDFPFVEASDRAHAVALLILPFVREMITGPTPLHLIEAPQAGSGKGLLNDVLLTVSTGTIPEPMPAPTEDDEWRKRITATLMEGPNTIFIDNINATIDSGSLAAALTALQWTDRVLGVSTMTRTPVRCTWVATANNPMLSTEIARRCIRIRIDPKIDKPWERSGFKHPNLRLWMREHLGELIWASVTLVRYGLKHGKAGRSLGSFESWATIVGTVLNGVGIEGFLENLDALYERADVQTAAWRALVEAWWEKHQDAQVQASELFPLLEENGINLDIRGRTPRGLQTAFGMALNKMEDRVLTLDDANPAAGKMHLRIETTGTSNRIKLWRLARVDTSVNVPYVPNVPYSPSLRTHVHTRAHILQADGVLKGTEGTEGTFDFNESTDRAPATPTNDRITRLAVAGWQQERDASGGYRYVHPTHGATQVHKTPFHAQVEAEKLTHD